MPEAIRIENAFLTVEVSPLGAETQSIVTSDGRSWLWHGDPAFWTGRAPILFPIVGKAPDDRLTIGGEPFAMNQHGFARRSTFALTEHSSEYCRYELAANAETRSQYPFDFHLSVEHRLEGAKLTVSVAVVNQGERSMPFGFGFHPAFAWPLPGAEGHHHHEILLDNGAEPALSRLEGGLRRPALLPSPFRKGRLALDPALFVEDAMIFPEGAGSSLIYRAENGPELRFTFENLPNLALWTKPGAPYLCIEPWHGTAPSAGTGAAIEDRPSTFVLGTGETSRFAYSVTFPVA